MNEFTVNLERLQAAVAASDFDAVVLTSPENCFFVTGVNAECMVLVSADDAVFATDFRYAEAAARVLAALCKARRERQYRAGRISHKAVAGKGCTPRIWRRTVVSAGNPLRRTGK